MNPSETNMTCDQYRDLIDRLADGELDALDVSALESHIVLCPACASELALAAKIARELDSLPFEHCPSEVTQSVLAHAAAYPLARPRPSWWRTWRPALAGAVAGILLLATAYVGQNSTNPPQQYTRAELERARAEAKWTLLFINQLSRKAASDLRDDVLHPHVVRKMLRLVDPNLDSTPKENEHAS